MTHLLRALQRYHSENYEILYLEKVHGITIIFMKMSFVKIIIRRKTQYPAPIIKVSHSIIESRSMDGVVTN